MNSIFFRRIHKNYLNIARLSGPGFDWVSVPETDEPVSKWKNITIKTSALHFQFKGFMLRNNA
jgi:hypothetical protein